MESSKTKLAIEKVQKVDVCFERTSSPSRNRLPLS